MSDMTLYLGISHIAAQNTPDCRPRYTVPREYSDNLRLFWDQYEGRYVVFKKKRFPVSIDGYGCLWNTYWYRIDSHLEKRNG